jgi:protein-disulfide isomerase
MTGLAVLLFLLVGFDFAYFMSLEDAAGVDATLDAPPHPAASGTDAANRDEACRYDPEKEPFADYMSLLSPRDPFSGNPTAPVKVIEFFDPNCPHCRTMYQVLKEVSKNHADDAMFVYKPFVLWQFSVDQSAALYAAAQDSRFFEMLELQFAEHAPGGLSREELQALAVRIGMDPDLMTRRIQSGVYLSALSETREQGRQAGVTAVPALMINGRWVDGNSRTAACIAQLIEEAAR